jgi:hypothetical protein
LGAGVSNVFGLQPTALLAGWQLANRDCSARHRDGSDATPGLEKLDMVTEARDSLFEYAGVAGMKAAELEVQERNECQQKCTKRSSEGGWKRLGITATWLSWDQLGILQQLRVIPAA